MKSRIADSVTGVRKSYTCHENVFEGKGAPRYTSNENAKTRFQVHAQLSHIYIYIFPKQSVAKKGFLLVLYRISFGIHPQQNRTSSNVLVGKCRPEVGSSRPEAMESNDLLVGKEGPR